MPQRWTAHEYGTPDELTLEDFARGEAAPQQVTVDVRASGINPIDVKRLAAGPGERPAAPLTFGFEVAGVIAAIADGVEIGTGAARVGDPVIAFQIPDGYSTEVTTAAANVFAMPSRLSFPEAANLMLVGTTASELLHRSAVAAGDTVLVHGGSGSVGNSVVQQARLLGARVIATGGAASLDRLKALGAEPVLYGPGLADRLRALAPSGIDAALDTVGSDEAIQTSLEFVADRGRIVSIASRPAAEKYGFVYIGAGMPGTAEYRMAARPRILELAGSGELAVHVARTFAFADAPDALRLLAGGHTGGKLALVRE